MRSYGGHSCHADADSENCSSAAFHNWVMLLLIPTLARIMILPAFLWLPYAKEYGLGGEIQQILTDQKRTFAMLIVAVSLLSPLLFEGCGCGCF